MVYEFHLMLLNSQLFMFFCGEYYEKRIVTWSICKYTKSTVIMFRIASTVHSESNNCSKKGFLLRFYGSKSCRKISGCLFDRKYFDDVFLSIQLFQCFDAAKNVEVDEKSSWKKKFNTQLMVSKVFMTVLEKQKPYLFLEVRHFIFFKIFWTIL